MLKEKDAGRYTYDPRRVVAPAEFQNNMLSLMKERVREVTLLQELTKRIIASTDLDEIVGEITQKTLAFLHATHTFFYLAEERHVWHLIAAAPLQREFYPAFLDKKVIERITDQQGGNETAQIVFLPSNDLMPGLFTSPASISILRQEGEALGIMGVVRNGRTALSRQDVFFLKNISGIGAGAIRNAKIVGSALQSAQRITELPKLLESLKRGGNVDGVLHLIAEEARWITKADWCCISCGPRQENGFWVQDVFPKDCPLAGQNLQFPQRTGPDDVRLLHFEKKDFQELPRAMQVLLTGKKANQATVVLGQATGSRNFLLLLGGGQRTRQLEQDWEFLKSLSYTAGKILDETATEREKFTRLDPQKAGSSTEGYDLMKQLISIHQHLVDKILLGANMSDVLSIIANLTGNRVWLEDNYFFLVAASDEALHLDEAWNDLISCRGTPQHFWGIEEFKTAIKAAQNRREAIRMPAKPEQGIRYPRIVLQVCLNNEVVGYIWIVEKKPLSQNELVVIEHAVNLLSMEIGKEVNKYKVQNLLKMNFLLGLKKGYENGYLLDIANDLNYTLDGWAVVAVVDLGGDQKRREANLPSMEYRQARLANLAEACLATSTAERLVVTHGGRLYVMAWFEKMPDLDKNSKIYRRFEELKGILRSFDPEFRPTVALGTTKGNLADLHRTLAQMEQNLNTMLMLGKGGGIATGSELGVFGLLSSLINHTEGIKEKELAEFCRTTLLKLANYDLLHSAGLMETLAAYFKTGGNLERAAVLCHVTGRTVKNRVAKIEELTAMSLSNELERFALEFAVKAGSMVCPKGTSLTDFLAMAEPKEFARQ